MLFAKQSTAKTINIGPCLDSAGAEYTGLVIGDLTIDKAGTSAAMAAAASLTATSNGHYDLVMTTGNTDTLGALQIRCNKSTYQIPTQEMMVLPATVYDALVTNATNGTGGLLAATGTVSAALGYIGASGAQVNGTNLNTLSGHDPGVTLGTGTSTLTQAQVSGGAYALNSSSFAFNSGLDLTSTQKTSVTAAVPTAAQIRAEMDSNSTDLDAIGTLATTINSNLAALIVTVGVAGAGLTAADDATLAAIALVQADTDNIQTRLPAALTGAGNMKADVVAVNGTTIDGTGTTLDPFGPV
jgi:hypothetical protein